MCTRAPLPPQLAASQEGVRHGASMALRNLVRGCIDEDMYVAAVAAGAPAARAPQPPLVSVVAAVAASLGARYQEGWPLAITGACCDERAALTWGCRQQRTTLQQYGAVRTTWRLALKRVLAPLCAWHLPQWFWS